MGISKLKSIREELGLTQDDVSAITGKSRRTIQYWEANDNAPEWAFDMIMNRRTGDAVKAQVAPVNTIPVLPTSAIGGTSTEFDDVGVSEYECEKVISPIKEAQLAIRVSGDSMYPRYSNGSLVFVKQINPQLFVEWGAYYVLSTSNGTIIKRVMQRDENSVECQSVNPSYTPFSVPKSEIRAMYKVLGCLHLE